MIKEIKGEKGNSILFDKRQGSKFHKYSTTNIK